MLPGSRSGRINYASYRLNGYFQASSPGYFTGPRPSGVDKVIGLKDTLWRFHLPAITCAVGLHQRGFQVNCSPSFFCQSEVGKTESPRSKEAGVLAPAPTLLACLCQRGRRALVGSASDFSADALRLRECRSFGAKVALHSHVVARPLPRPSGAIPHLPTHHG